MREWRACLLGQTVSLGRIIYTDDLDTLKISWFGFRYFALLRRTSVVQTTNELIVTTQEQRVAQKPAPRHAENFVGCLTYGHRWSIDSETLWPKALSMVWRAPGSFQEASGRIVATCLNQWPCRLIVKCKRVALKAKRWG